MTLITQFYSGRTSDPQNPNHSKSSHQKAMELDGWIIRTLLHPESKYKKRHSRARTSILNLRGSQWLSQSDLQHKVYFRLNVIVGAHSTTCLQQKTESKQSCQQPLAPAELTPVRARTWLGGHTKGRCGGTGRRAPRVTQGVARQAQGGCMMRLTVVKWLNNSLHWQRELNKCCF